MVVGWVIDIGNYGVGHDSWEEYGMSNLGKYQVLVEAAKKAGGPDSLIKNIGDGAVAKAAPGIFLKGVGVTTLLIGLGITGYKIARDKLRDPIARGTEAEAELRAALAESARPDGAGSEHDE